MTNKSKFWVRHLLVFLGVAVLVMIMNYQIPAGEKNGMNYSQYFPWVAALVILITGYGITEGSWGARGKIEGIKEYWQAPLRLILFMMELMILLVLGNHISGYFNVIDSYMGKEMTLAGFFMRFTIYYAISWWLARQLKREWFFSFFLALVVEIFTWKINPAHNEATYPGTFFSIITLSGFIAVLFAFLSSYRVKILIWKELRETWWAFAVAVMIPFLISLAAGFDMAFLFTSIALSLLFAGFLGGRSFASETENQTMEFISTRPLHLRTLLLVKYFTGVGLIVLLTLISFSMLIFSDKAVSYEIYMGVMLASTPMIFFFSLCLIFSFIVKDSIRSSLLGFGGTIVFGLLFFTLTKSYSGLAMVTFLTKDQFISYLAFIKTFFYFLIFLSLMTGITGMIYYSSLKKRLEWKNGFALMIPSALILTTLFNGVYFGSMRADYYSKWNRDNITSSFAVHLWNQKIYYLTYTMPGASLKVKYLDISDPENTEIHVMATALPVCGGGFLTSFDKNLCYGVSTAGYETGSELIKYDFSQGTAINETGRLKLPPLPATAFSGWTTAKIIDLYADESSLYLHLFQRVKYVYYDKHWKELDVKNPGKYHQKRYSVKNWYAVVDKNSFQIRDLFPVDSTMNIESGLSGVRYKQYAFSYEPFFAWNREKSLCLYDVSDWKHARLIKKDILKTNVNRLYESSRGMVSNVAAVRGDYLYVSMDENALRIFDLSHLPEIKEVSRVPYGFANRVIYKDSDILSYRQLVLDGNNAFVINPRGVLWIDVTDPGKPAIKGKDFSYDPSSLVLYADNKLYTFGNLFGDMRIYDFNRRKN